MGVKTTMVPALVARRKFGRLVRRATERQQRFIVGRRGEPQVVIMGVNDFVRTIAPEAEVLALIGQESKRKGTSKLTLRQIEKEIARARREKRAAHAPAKGRA